jgi:hypothetical protein
VGSGVSAVQESRPALDDLLRAARRRQVDTLVCWRLDRLGRNLRHLIPTPQKCAKGGRTSLFVLLALPGFISTNVYDLLVPSHNRNTSARVFEATAYGVLNLSVWLCDSDRRAAP